MTARWLRHQGELVGWYDSADQPRDQPTYNPPFAGPCVVCFQPLTEDTVRTISVMALDGSRCYFYRLHRSCHDGLTEQEQVAYDEAALATHAGAPNG